MKDNTITRYITTTYEEQIPKKINDLNYLYYI